MEVTLSIADNGSRSGIIRHLFFHQLNSSLTPLLFTFRNQSMTYTKTAAELLNQPEFIDYVIMSSDTLSRIAGHYTTSADNWQQIAEINGITRPKALTRGQVIKIPIIMLKEEYRINGISSASSRASSPRKRTSYQPPKCGTNNADCIMHRVGTNESLSIIAQTMTGDVNNWNVIADVNHITDPEAIVIGQPIFIPKKLLPGDMDETKPVEASNRVTFLTVYQQKPKTMHRAVQSVFSEFGISILQSQPSRIESTVWEHDSMRFTFSISLRARDKGTELSFLCFAAPNPGEEIKDLDKRSQRWTEEYFFPALDRTIKELTSRP